MSVFAVGLEDGEIEEIRRQFPGFKGDVPEEARFWSKSDLTQFCRSNGKQRPHQATDSDSQSCSLLSRLRVQLAEQKINKATAEYLSYCRHRKERSQQCKLVSVAACTPVTRVREAPEPLQVPVTIVPRRDKELACQSWNLSFWTEACGDEWCTCRFRSPAFETDEGMDTVTVEAGLWEYAEYIRVLDSVDPNCLEENSLAYPRVQIDAWCPFSTCGRELFDQSWKSLNPPGLKDLTARWIETYAGVLEDGDWLQHLARFYQISIGAVGSVTRLHCENNGAHVWFTQIEGQRMFFLFPPQDAGKLYEERGSFVSTSGLYATAVSSVDPLYPSAKRHPRFNEAAAQVALLGEGKTLIIPAGWWYYSVVTEPSVTLRHPFWTMENKNRIVDELWAPYEGKDVPPDVREHLRPRFTEFRDLVQHDDGTDMDYVVIDGG